MQTIIDAWFVQGMIKATSDAWLKGWDDWSTICTNRARSGSKLRFICAHEAKVH